MVKKYVILADSKNDNFEIPRQLTEINGEPLTKRTIRLLKENGINDIYITSHDKRFSGLGAIRYEPKYNIYNPEKGIGYYLDGYPIELLKEPITFLFGDVYYSENAIKTIVNTETESTLFFCTYENKDKRYIKNHDEPLAFKVKDYKLFKKHLDIVKKAKDEEICCREPLTWELYRSINNQNINTHKMTENYIIINDESCDIDDIEDIELLRKKLKEMKLSIIIPYYKTYELTVKLLDKLIPQLTNKVEVYLIDDGCKEKKLDKYKENINIIHLPKNVGGASATNKGLEKCIGEYIALIDSDDLITDDYIETLLKYISEREEDVIFFDWQDMNTGQIVRHPNNYAPWKAIYKNNIMPKFRDGWIYSYDVPFQEDLDKTNYSRYYIDKVLYYYNSNRPGNLTTEKEKIIRGKK